MSKHTSRNQDAGGIEMSYKTPDELVIFYGESLNRNVDRFYADQITFEEFNKRNQQIWNGIHADGLDDRRDEICKVERR